MRDTYFFESIQLALDGMNLSGALTPEQVAELASSLAVSLENESMATGRDRIPNPMEAQLREARRSHVENVSRLERSHAEQVRELEWTINRLRNRIRELEQAAA